MSAVAYSRVSAVVISGSDNISLSNVSIHNIGGSAVTISGSHNSVSDSSVQYVGCTGISVDGGDIATLTASGNTILNNNIHQYAQRKRTYQPAVGFRGVGHQVINNTVGDAPHCGMLGGGNDMLFEGNTLHNLGYEVDDSGAFYVGRQWQARGNVVRGNTFRHIRARVPTYLGYPR